MSTPNQLSSTLTPSTPPESTPIEFDEEDFRTAIVIFKWKSYGRNRPPPSLQRFLNEVTRDGRLLLPGGGGFIRKKALLPLWIEFVTTVWQPMHKDCTVDPMDFSNCTITSSRAAGFLQWLRSRRTYNVDAVGQPADGTRWWPHDVLGVLAAVQQEHRNRLRGEEEDEAGRQAELLGTSPLEEKRILEWRKGVKTVGLEEAMLLGMVSREYEARAPLAAVLRRPASGLDEEEEYQMGAEDEDSCAATPVGRSSIQAGGIDERTMESQRDVDSSLQEMVQVARTLAEDHFRSLSR